MVAVKPAQLPQDSPSPAQEPVSGQYLGGTTKYPISSYLLIVPHDLTISSSPSFTVVAVKKTENETFRVVVEAAQKCTFKRSRNPSEAAFLQLHDPVSCLLQEPAVDNDDLFSFGVKLYSKFKGLLIETSQIAASILTLAKSSKVDPILMSQTLLQRPNHLRNVHIGKSANVPCVIGSYIIEDFDMQSLEPQKWLSDNVSMNYLVKIVKSRGTPMASTC